MSDSMVVFHFDDGERGYGVYQGSADLTGPFMTKDAFKVFTNHENQGKPNFWDRSIECEKLGHPTEHVLVENTYGGGEQWWHGQACRGCFVFHGPYDPMETKTYKGPFAAVRDLPP